MQLKATKAASAAFVISAAGAAALLAACAQNPVTGGSDFVLMTEAQEASLGARYHQEALKEYRLYDLKPVSQAPSGPAAAPAAAQGGAAPAAQGTATQGMATPGTATQGAAAEGLAAYVEALGQRLARQSHRPGLAWRFTLVDSPEVNAFALPGGYVYVTRGLLAYLNSEAELAAVLGHEIGHVTARHGVRQASAAQGTDIALTLLSVFTPALRNSGLQGISSALGGALLAGYGRDHELEADRLGAEYLARGNWDPDAMIRVVGALKSQELFDADAAKAEGREPRRYHGVFATHPDNDTRFREVVQAARALQPAKPDPSTEGRERFLARTEGMVFGDSPQDGFVREGRFWQPELGISIAAPEGWRVQNLPDRVVFVAPGEAARIQMKVSPRPGNLAPADLFRQLVRANPAELDVAPVNGLAAAQGTWRGQFGAVLYLGERAYTIAGIPRTPQELGRNMDAFRAAVRSFRQMDAAERARIRPYALKLITANAGTRFAALAQASPLGRQAEGYLRLVNGMYPKGEPQPGQRIKVVE